MSELRGLVLCGGRSRRMGVDKATLLVDGVPQWKRMAELLAPFCTEVFWSCRAEQRDAWGLGERALVDETPDRGPAEGLRVAFAQVPGAWLVVGCDYPTLRREDIAALVAERGPAFHATALLRDDGAGPEPLLALWEPAALQRLNGSPRAALDGGPVRLVDRGQIHNWNRGL